MDHTKSEQIAELIQHSHNMLQNAENGEWEKVIEEEEYRRALINRVFAENQCAIESPVTINAINEVIDINKKLQTIATKARDIAGNSAKSIRFGRNAANVYSENSG